MNANVKDLFRKHRPAGQADNEGDSERFVVHYDADGAASVSSSSVVGHALKYLDQLHASMPPTGKRIK